MNGETRRTAALTLALAFGLLAATPAAAMDGSMLLNFDREELEAEAGETVTVDLVASTHGNSVGNGIDDLSATIEYDADVITVADVEHGPMLAAGDDDATVDATAEIDDDAGAVTIDQERTPSGSGAKATDTVVTLTLEIDDDAPSTTETLEITDASASYPSDYSLTPVDRDLELSIEGTDDAVPGFVPLTAVVGLAVALWLLYRR
ncbi:cohesin domain-containing protein [Natronolimnohabitans sp. A-GB9]|uniref:cohesin domain-containing protein n=1 Tax=Natronolimnohabitans sp. A-GB9 TaxID=3069757 RepID=UPI0027B182A8|nr:cohesin domain-containing protein [Natronolimnohabitans sp. A-GB9]MDQ2048907.1 cohesin domain-containing protein [Natronolimnohabitans sp. A-GB9]